MILYIDELQWAEPMLLDLLGDLVDLSRDAPILVLCAARPWLLEEQPTWSGGKLNATTVLLSRLLAQRPRRCSSDLGDGLGPEARAQIITASEGDPLFLSELAALARERGTVAVPATIRALLAARLERLASEDREVLEERQSRERSFTVGRFRPWSATAERTRSRRDSPGWSAKSSSGPIRQRSEPITRSALDTC